jgi:hypothetical protein
VDNDGSPPPALGDRDAILLRALRERYPGDQFDALNISTTVAGNPELLAAMGFLGARIDRSRRRLTHRSLEAVAEWLDRVEGLPVGGLTLTRNRIGWARVEAVGAVPTGCTGPAG